MRDYTKIVAWQKADDLTVAVYGATKSFPRDEIYSLTSQLRRAAYSVAANIVEGASRESKKDYLHFLYIARGSLSEARYFIHLSCRLQYLDEERCRILTEQADEALRVLAGLVGAVERETGLVARTVARVSSAFVLGLGLMLRG
ncbi:MAG: four helix bundle protein [bacterium]